MNLRPEQEQIIACRMTGGDGQSPVVGLPGLVLSKSSNIKLQKCPPQALNSFSFLVLDVKNNLDFNILMS